MQQISVFSRALNVQRDGVFAVRQFDVVAVVGTVGGRHGHHGTGAYFFAFGIFDHEINGQIGYPLIHREGIAVVFGRQVHFDMQVRVFLGGCLINGRHIHGLKVHHAHGHETNILFAFNAQLKFIKTGFVLSHRNGGKAEQHHCGQYQREQFFHV